MNSSLSRLVRRPRQRSGPARDVSTFKAVAIVLIALTLSRSPSLQAIQTFLAILGRFFGRTEDDEGRPAFF